MKFANMQVNRHNREAIEACFVMGEVEIGDLKVRCKGLDPSKPEERAILIDSVH